jgi:chemotaxis protein methyltransferase CheR
MSEQTDITPAQQADYDAFKAKVYKKCGIDLNLYKQAQMHRRLLGMVERAGRRNFVEYFDMISASADEWAQFLDRMTINVSELYRNPEKWAELQQDVLPKLLQHRSTLRIWSAGCSIGAEPYTLAMILKETTPHTRHMLLATDIDQKILARAQKGIFTEADVRSVPAAVRGRWMQTAADGSWEVKPELRAMVTFRRHNLLADPFEGDFDLIVCRNVVIYFTDEAKDKLYERFTKSLRPGGCLFVGGTERIFNYRELGLSTPVPFFYERAA